MPAPESLPDRTCPECGAHNGLLERQPNGLYFCGCCSVRILFDDQGKVLRVLQR